MSDSDWPVRNDYGSGRTEQRVPDAPIATEKVIIDRKIFFLDLKENARGRFMKITEDVGGRRDTIMLPAPAFEDFAAALNRLVEYERSLS